jgi:hypothetical protein
VFVGSLDPQVHLQAQLEAAEVEAEHHVRQQVRHGLALNVSQVVQLFKGKCWRCWQCLVQLEAAEVEAEHRVRRQVRYFVAFASTRFGALPPS